MVYFLIMVCFNLHLAVVLATSQEVSLFLFVHPCLMKGKWWSLCVYGGGGDHIFHISDYIALNGEMMDELERIQKKVVMAT
jgi:uncharacterized membrane protein